jgi:outer membrane protein OmpA-like peptidoglycan-associated protein
VVAGTFWASAVFADPAAETVVAESAEPGPGSMEAGVFVGGFISNYFHQFYDTSDPAKSGKLEKLNDVAPQFGIRYAVFPHQNFGIEGEGSVSLEATESMGDSVTIYRLGAQAILQYPARITPFVGVGFGMWHSTSETLGDSTHFPLHAGLGLRFFATNSIALRADLRFYRGPSYQDPYTLNASYGEFNVGMSWVPGASGGAAVVHEDLDPDHDGVVGAADLCPNEYGSNPDGCPTRDKDGDGIPDAKDKCPDQPETINGYQDEDGCPDSIPDTDGDGINDLLDKCKTEPEDKDGFQDADGCPDLDNDNDGVTDAMDKCPNVAGPIENAGCPDTDRDGDGVVDRLDNCPDEPGDPKNHGCKKKQLVEITKDQLKILDTVRFQTGSAKLLKQSNGLLDNVAAVINTHPEIWKVHVDGHTDNVGKADLNMKLSNDRAQSVVDYLVNTGKVAPERLESAGHGQDMPIGDNKTAKGREQNRRVEFNIMRQEAPAASQAVPPPPKLERKE